eukprot:1682644-Rhodomonas_salina.1
MLPPAAPHIRITAGQYRTSVADKAAQMVYPLAASVPNTRRKRSQKAQGCYLNVRQQRLAQVPAHPVPLRSGFMLKAQGSEFTLVVEGSCLHGSSAQGSGRKEETQEGRGEGEGWSDGSDE